MRCPRCRTENAEDARFCSSCGRTLGEPSRGRKLFQAMLHAFLYIALFLGIQVGISIVCSFVLSMNMTMSHMMAGGVPDEQFVTDITEKIAELLTGRIHVISILSGLITILVLVISFRVRRKDAVSEMHVRKISPGRVPWCVVLGIALQPVINFLLGFLPEELLNHFAETNAINYATDPLPLELLNVVLLTPIVEELIFRGLALTRLRRGMGTVFAVILSAVIFGVIHGHPVSILYASVLGVVLALLMLRNNDSVLAPILCHMGFNGGNYLMLLMAPYLTTPLYLALCSAALALTVLSAYMVFRSHPDAE